VGAKQTLQLRGLSYHILIDESANRHDLVDVMLVAHHAANANHDSIGIALVGDFGRMNPTESQLIQLVAVVEELQHRFGGNLAIQNHRDVSNTSCPVIDLATVVKSRMVKSTVPHHTGRVHDWSLPARKWAHENGISDLTRMCSTATREELVTMLHNFDQMLSKRTAV
jgi:N-acetyl-anhydromuramyl-L-alanine amidase AmpD